MGSVFERRAAGVYHNTAVVLDADGQLAGIYRKMHIPDDPLYYEKYYFTPGDLGFQRVRHAVRPRRHAGLLGPVVSRRRRGSRRLRGAEILFYPTAIGWHPAEKAEYGAAQHDAWETMQRAHAIANGVFVAAVNRVGHEGDPAAAGIEFWGASFVCDPFGSVLAEASQRRTEDPRRRVRPGATRRPSGATGPSCATAASTPTARSPSASSTPMKRPRAAVEPPQATQGRRAALARPTSAGTTHAGRVGAARGHLARLAAPRARLAGQFRAHPLGLRRDRPRARRAASACASSSTTRPRSGAPRACSRRPASTSGGSISSRRDRPRLDARHGPDLRPARRATARESRPTGASTAGPSTPTTAATPRSAPPSRSGSRLPRGSRIEVGGRRVVLEGGASTSTARARCSRPRSACSPTSRRATRASAAPTSSECSPTTSGRGT